MLKKLFKKDNLPLVLFVTAFVVRLIYLIDYSRSPFFEVHIADAMFHEAWAKRILNGDIFSLRMPGVLYKAPFYPYFIALSYFISGSSNDFLMFLQVLMSSFSCVLIFLIGRRPLGDAAAFIGATLYNFYFPAVYFSTEMEIPAVAVFLTLLSFYLIAAHRKIPALVGGAILYGLSVTALPTNLLLLPLYLFSAFKNHPEKSRGIRRTALFVALFALTLLPSTVRNAAEGGRFVPVSANGGINLYIGNNENYDETVYLQPGYKFEAFYDEPGRVEGANTVSERNDYWYRKTLAFVTERPGEALLLVFKKAVLYFANYEIYRNTDMYYAKSVSIYKHIPFVPAAWILALGFVGAWRAFLQRKGRALLALASLLALPCILFFVTARYRLPSLAVLSLFAGYGALSVFDAFREKRRRTGVVFAALVLGIATLSYLNLFVVKNPEYRPRLNLGFIHESRGANDRALEAYETALRLIEKSRPRDRETESELHARIGNVLMTMNRLNKAESRFRTAAQIAPNSAAAHAYLGSLYVAKNNLESAEQAFRKALEINPRDVVTLHNLGRLYLDNRDLEKAATLFHRALKIAPEHAGVHRDLAVVYDLKGDTDRMEAESKTALFYNPRNTAARYNLAAMYYRTGREADAVQQYNIIIEKTPDKAGTAYTRLGVISARKGDLPQAVKYWKKALSLDPSDRAAGQNLRKAESILNR